MDTSSAASLTSGNVSGVNCRVGGVIILMVAGSRKFRFDQKTLALRCFPHAWLIEFSRCVEYSLLGSHRRSYRVVSWQTQDLRRGG